MAIQLDDIHYNSRKIDGYNVPFNFIVSEREAGKTTWIVMKKLYQSFKEGHTSLIIRRQITDITDVYIEDFAKLINKFSDDQVKFTYKKSSLKDGLVDVYIGEKEAARLFVRIVALSNPINRIKSTMLPNIKYLLFDEFICNPEFQEKYLAAEATRFKEIYNTYQRETTMLKCYFIGNPYSDYNPYYVWLGVDTNKLKRGQIQRGINWAVEKYEITQELREAILAKNPLYQFDDSYTRYALHGESVNDANIKLSTLKENYKMKFVFRIDNKYLGVFQNNYLEDRSDKYFVKVVDNVSAKRCIYCFDFNQLIDRTCLLSINDKCMFNRFKIAMRRRQVEFETIECYYLMIEIYNNL